MSRGEKGKARRLVTKVKKYRKSYGVHPNTVILFFILGGLSSGWQSGMKSGAASSDLDLIKIGQARNKIMDIKLNQVLLFKRFLKHEITCQH